MTASLDLFARSFGQSTPTPVVTLFSSFSLIIQLKRRRAASHPQNLRERSLSLMSAQMFLLTMLYSPTIRAARSRNRRGIMAASLEDQLIDKVRALPPNKQQEALRLLDTLASGTSSDPNGTSADRRPIWEIVEEVNAGSPADTWENVPTDGSINLDHYLYGAPKQQP
jgi:hypothetical protein